jgi:endonuclease G
MTAAAAAPRAPLARLALALALALAAACGNDTRAVWRRDGAREAAPGPSGADAQAPPRGRPASNRGRQLSPHLALGAPVDADPSDDQLVVKPQYALSYNARRLGANWVSWALNASHFGPTPRHQGKFIADEQLPAGVTRARHEDYTDSGFDRGHMVRSEERTASADDNRATFLMTNVLPQTHDLNAGPWLRLEEYCQDLARRGKELAVVAGPLYGANPPRIGRNGVAVPEAFFKVVVVLERGQGAADVRPDTRAIAVRMPNVKGIMADEWRRYRVRIDDVERASGYDLLPDVAEAVQAVVEARVDAD